MTPPSKGSSVRRATLRPVNILRPSTSHQLAWHAAHLPFGNEIAEPTGVGKLGQARAVSIHGEYLEDAVAVAMEREVHPVRRPRGVNVGDVDDTGGVR